MKVAVRKSMWGHNKVLAMTCDCSWTRIAFTHAGAEVLAQDHLNVNHKRQDHLIIFEEES